MLKRGSLLSALDALSTLTTMALILIVALAGLRAAGRPSVPLALNEGLQIARLSVHLNIGCVSGRWQRCLKALNLGDRDACRELDSEFDEEVAEFE